jgi:Gpi18-like mannosyltransferase
MQRESGNALTAGTRWRGDHFLQPNKAIERLRSETAEPNYHGATSVLQRRNEKRSKNNNCTGVTCIFSIGLFAWTAYDTNYDLTIYVIPWYQHILSEGRLASLHGNFSDYTPPYIYLLSIASLFDGSLDPIISIKLCSIIWGLFGAFQCYQLLKRIYTSQQAFWLSLIFYTLPEVTLNSAVWGQSDIIYISFLVACVRYLFEGRRAVAMIMYGAALAFKPQAVFIAPFIAAIFIDDLLDARRIVKAICHALLVPIAYAVAMIPSLLAGKHLSDFFTFYGDQFTASPKLNWAAPNPYLLLEYLRIYGAQLADHTQLGWVERLAIEAHNHANAVASVGLLFALAVCCVTVLNCYQAVRAKHMEQMIQSIALTALLVPFVTPKMHDRYFIAASVFAYLLACINPKKMGPIICLQLSAMVPYSRFLFSVPRNPLASSTAVALTSVALILLFKYTMRLGERRSAMPLLGRSLHPHSVVSATNLTTPAARP